MMLELAFQRAKWAHPYCPAVAELILIRLLVTLRKSEFSTAKFTARAHSANPS